MLGVWGQWLSVLVALREAARPEAALEAAVGPCSQRSSLLLSSGRAGPAGSVRGLL